MLRPFRLAVALLPGLLAASGCGSESPIEGYNRLHAMQEELAALPAAEQLTDQPYLNGKVIVVAFREGYPGVVEGPVTELVVPYSWSPEEEFVAVTPEEVGTVGRMDCTRAPAGRYETAPVGGLAASYEALRETCVLSLIDRSIPAVIHRRTFEGPAPSDTVQVDLSASNTTVNLDVSRYDVLAYLRDLPRR